MLFPIQETELKKEDSPCWTEQELIRKHYIVHITIPPRLGGGMWTGWANTENQWIYRLIEDGERMRSGWVRSELRTLDKAYFEAEDDSRSEGQTEGLGVLWAIIIFNVADVDTNIVVFRRWRSGINCELKVRLTGKMFGCHGRNLATVSWVWGGWLLKDNKAPEEALGSQNPRYFGGRKYFGLGKSRLK